MSHRKEIAVAASVTLEQLRASIAEARLRLAKLETAYTLEKNKVDILQARLFMRLRAYYQECERLRLIASYRQEFLEAALRADKNKGERVEREFQQAKAQSDQEYEDTAKKLAAKKELTAGEEEELAKLWKKLVKLYHPDRFAHEPAKLETYGKLTAAINRAKDSGDIALLNEIAHDPHGFILRQGWASLDLREEDQTDRLRKLLKSLELEIVRILEATSRVRASPEFELQALIGKNPELFDRVATKREKVLKQEIADLRLRANQLARQIEEITGNPIHY